MNKIFILKWILRLHAVVLLAALIPIFFPWSLMNTVHQWLGLGDLPKSVMTDYLTRSLSLVYALHGAVCLVLTFDLAKYLPLIRTIAVFHFGFGLFMLGIDLQAGLPWYWTISEGPMISIFAVFIFVFAGRCLKDESLQVG